MAPRFEDLKPEYADLWQRVEVRSDRVAAVNQIATRLLGFKSRYQSVSRTTDVPWFVIAVIHNRESDANFATYLGNGEPLNRTTRLVPAGRGPFASWEAGAIDALAVDHLDKITDWTPERACYAFETFNGFGYRNQHPPVNSPYLWSFSNLYQSGKYVADRQFRPSAVDPQCGTMPIIKQIMALDPTATFKVESATAPDTTTSPLSVGSRGDRVKQLQSALKQRGYSVGDIDGIYGTVTRDAVTAFQRDANLPATGIADPDTLTSLAAPTPPPAPAPRPVTPAPPSLQPMEILRILFGELGKIASGIFPRAGGTPSGTVSATDIMQQILRAVIAAPVATTTAGATPAATPQIVLSPIDNVLGGQALAGKKTALAIVAYAVVAILQAVGVVGSGTPAGIIVNTIIVAFGGLGVLSKIDRVIQTLGVIAAKPPA
jgi:lysozyme family protein/peptidoglycan hydrolase-like protein with peptidoglycan-binding domain